MRKILLVTLVITGMSVFAEMGLVPVKQLIKRGKSNAVLVARNTKLTDITRVAGYMAGTEMGANAPVAPVYAEGYFPVYRNDDDNTGLGYELQAWSEPLQKTVSANIFFYEQGDDLYVYLYNFKIRGNEVGTVSLYSAGSYYEPSTKIDGDKPCLCGLRVWISGRDRVADYGFWNSTGKTLWEGVSPTELVDYEGIITGGYCSYLMHLLGYNVKDADGVRTVQLQTWGTNDMTRAVHVSLKAEDGNVNATIDQVRRDNAGGGFKVGGNSTYLSGAQTIVNSENGNGIAARGLEARIERRVSTPIYAGYLQETLTVVWENINIADIISINGDMNGGWMNEAAPAMTIPFMLYKGGLDMDELYLADFLLSSVL